MQAPEAALGRSDPNYQPGTPQGVIAPAPGQPGAPAAPGQDQNQTILEVLGNILSGG